MALAMAVCLAGVGIDPYEHPKHARDRAAKKNGVGAFAKTKGQAQRRAKGKAAGKSRARNRK
jgi:hypothetical protein